MANNQEPAFLSDKPVCSGLLRSHLLVVVMMMMVGVLVVVVVMEMMMVMLLYRSLCRLGAGSRRDRLRERQCHRHPEC